MPEVGETVMLAFPEANEEKAYVCRVKRLDGLENGYTAEPKNRFLGIPGESSVHVLPESMKFEVKPNDLYISFKDEEGVQIISSDDIWMQGGDSMKITAESIDAVAKNKLVLSNEATSILVDSMVHVKG